MAPANKKYDTKKKTSCMLGRTPNYQYRVGIIIGSLQMLAGILSVILSGASYALKRKGVDTYPAIGIWAGLAFYIPAGIIGILAKKRNTFIIALYLSWCVLSSVIGPVMFVIEGVVALVEAFVYVCKTFLPIVPIINVVVSRLDVVCNELGVEEVVIVHGILAFIGCLEFVASVVAAAFCCDGLFFQKPRRAAFP